MRIALLLILAADLHAQMIPSMVAGSVGGLGGDPSARRPYASLIKSYASLAAYWRMDEASGDLVDSSGAGLTATASNLTYSAAGGVLRDSDTAVTFNGTTSMALLASSSSLNFDRTSTFSVEFLLKPNSARTGTATYAIITKRGESSPFKGWSVNTDWSTNGGLAVSANNVELTLCASSVANTRIIVYGSTDLLNGFWYHVLITYDGSGVAAGVKMYVNGAAELTHATQDGLGANAITNSVVPSIGVFTDGVNSAWWQNGSIDELAIYTAVLTAADAKAHARYLVPYATQLGGIVEAVSADSSGNLYTMPAVGATGIIRKSTDRGHTWTDLKTFSTASFSRVSFVDSTGNIFLSPYGMTLGSGDKGLWMSSDSGANWSRVLDLSGIAVNPVGIWAMCEDPTTANLFVGVYVADASTSGATIYKSTDHGANWSSVYNNASARHIHDLNASAAGVIYATVGDNIAPWSTQLTIKSTDGGTVWASVAAVTTAGQNVPVLATATSRIFGADDGTTAIRRTINDTAVSTTLSLGSNIGWAFWLRQDPVTSNIFCGFVVNAQGSAGRVMIYKSIDDGVNWTLFYQFSGGSYSGPTFASQVINGVIYVSMEQGPIAAGSTIAGTTLNGYAISTR